MRVLAMAAQSRLAGFAVYAKRLSPLRAVGRTARPYAIIALRFWIFVLSAITFILLLVLVFTAVIQQPSFNPSDSIADVRQKCAMALDRINQLKPANRSSISCQKLFRGDVLETCRAKWIHDGTEDYRLLRELNKCEKFSVSRGYPLFAGPEADFPVAYSIMAHRNFYQLERLLRMIYAPQNSYCIHVDRKTPELANDVLKLASCFPNIFLVNRPVYVTWAGFGVLKGTLNCLEHLLIADKNWKYFINLSGMDFPLKTNRELVKYLQSLNGYSQAEVKLETKLHRFQYSYETTKNRLGIPIEVVRTFVRKSPPPARLTICRGNLAGLFSREFAEWTRTDATALALESWLNDTYIPDEHYWATLLCNRKADAPGGLQGRRPGEYLARYSQWRPSDDCHGKYVHDVCIFGAQDIAALRRLPHMFVNKIYADFESPAYDCLEEWFLAKRASERRIA